MNVLVLSNCPADPHTGSGSAIDLVLRELASAGARAEFVYLKPKGIFGSTRGARYLAVIRGLFEGTRRVRQGVFDLVICFGGEWGLFTRWVSRRPRSWRLLQYSNGVESHAVMAMQQAAQLPEFPRPRWFQRGNLSRVHDLAFVHADHVAVLSAFDARYLSDVLRVPPGRVTIRPTPLPAYFLGRPPPASRPRRIGYCGSWQARKNISLITHDVTRFLRAFPDWQFEAVGPGTETLQQSAAFGADVVTRVRGRGGIDRERLPEWYAECAIVLLPSIYESLGLAAAEAMACGCAVIGSSGSAFAASLRQGEEVYLLESPCPPFLERALVELARDDALRDRIAAGGHARAQALSLEQWRRAFHALLGGR